MFGTPEFQVIAKLDRDGNVTAKVQGFCSYGERQVSRSIDVVLDDKDEAKLKGILSKAIESAEVEVIARTGERDKDGELVLDDEGNSLREIKKISLGQQIFNDAARALTVATEKGEKV